MPSLHILLCKCSNTLKMIICLSKQFTDNKINGAVRRNDGKQMNRETK